jgi:hypothetical protein
MCFNFRFFNIKVSAQSNRTGYIYQYYSSSSVWHASPFRLPLNASPRLCSQRQKFKTFFQMPAIFFSYSYSGRFGGRYSYSSIVLSFLLSAKGFGLGSPRAQLSTNPERLIGGTPGYLCWIIINFLDFQSDPFFSHSCSGPFFGPAYLLVNLYIYYI